MRHLLRLQSPTDVDDGEGGQTVTWTSLGTVWGQVLPISSREAAQAGAVQLLATHRVLVHYHTRFTARQRLDRVDPTGTQLEVIGLRDPDGYQRYLELECAEVVS